jgi:hypothetical protein
MSPSTKIHALIPIFNLSFGKIYLITLIIDWGVILLLRYIEPQGLHRAWWWSNIYGDIFLPLGIASSSIVLKHYSYNHSWYSSRAWNWIVLIFGIGLIVFIEGLLLARKKYKPSDLKAYSKIWHSIIFPVMFYLSVITLIPLLVTRKPSIAFAGATAGYTIWLVCVIRDWLVSPLDYL